MSQQTFTPGGTQVAEPPAPVLPMDDAGSGDDNRRKLMIVGAAAGVAVLAIVAFFLMKGGSSPASNDRPIPAFPHHTSKAAPAVQPPVVKLPKHVAAPVGRDPFKALYTAPVAAAAGPASTTPTTTTPSTGGTTTTTTSGSTTTPTTTTTTYHPVWVQLKSFTTTAATFDVGYSNGKTLKAVRFTGVKPLHTFGSHFELLSIHSSFVTLKYGDGSPFQLDRSRNTMVVD